MGGVIGIVVSACVIGLVWAALNYLMVRRVQVGYGSTGNYESVDGENTEVSESEARVILEIGEKISEVEVSVFRAQRNF